MAKVPTNVCEVCRKEHCDGKVYRIKKFVDTDADYFVNWRGCQNSEGFCMKYGKPHFHWVMSHGAEDYWELEEV